MINIARWNRSHIQHWTSPRHSYDIVGK